MLLLCTYDNYLLSTPAHFQITGIVGNASGGGLGDMAVTSKTHPVHMLWSKYFYQFYDHLIYGLIFSHEGE